MIGENCRRKAREKNRVIRGQRSCTSTPGSLQSPLAVAVKAGSLENHLLENLASLTLIRLWAADQSHLPWETLRSGWKGKPQQPTGDAASSDLPTTPSKIKISRPSIETAATNLITGLHRRLAAASAVIEGLLILWVSVPAAIDRWNKMALD